MPRGRGLNKDKDSDMRKCIVNRDVESRHGLVRFVLSPDGSVVPDLAEKLPGRGVWVGADRALIDQATKKGHFSRGFKAPARAPDDLSDQVAALLKARLHNLIALARKSGQAIGGADKVRDWLSQEKVVLLFQASDGSSREKANTRSGVAKNRIFEFFTARELGMAFGRDNVIHAALTGAGITKTIMVEANRLEGVHQPPHVT